MEQTNDAKHSHVVHRYDEGNVVARTLFSPTTHAHPVASRSGRVAVLLERTHPIASRSWRVAVLLVRTPDTWPPCRACSDALAVPPLVAPPPAASQPPACTTAADLKQTALHCLLVRLQLICTVIVD